MRKTPKNAENLNFVAMIKNDWLVLLMIVGSFIIGLAFYQSLPSRMPTHWGFNGQPDQYSSKAFAVTFLPLLNLALFFGLPALPFIDPKKKNYVRFQGAFRIIRLAVTLFFVTVYILSLLIGLGYKLDMGLLIQVGLGIMFVIIGNELPRLWHNYLLGIRTPWTLCSEEVWRRTHRIAGPIWVVAGLITLAGAFAGSPTRAIIMLVSLGVAAAIPIVYSYIIFSRMIRLHQ